MFLDIGAGILLAILVGNVFDISLSSSWIFAGIMFALIPDMDIIPYALRRAFKQYPAYNHRTLTHYPIIYLPIAMGVCLLLGAPYAVLFFVCTIFHLLHDTVWLGWGIAWAWPFSKRKYKFFPDRYGKITSQALMTWREDEEKALFEKYHNPHWIRDFYFKPNIVAYVEYGVFAAALVALAILL